MRYEVKFFRRETEIMRVCSPLWEIYCSWVCLCMSLAPVWQMNGPAHHKWTWAEVQGSEIVSRKYDVCGKIWMKSQTQGEKCAYSIERWRWRRYCFQAVFTHLWLIWLEFFFWILFAAANLLKCKTRVNYSTLLKKALTDCKKFTFATAKRLKREQDFLTCLDLKATD